MPEAAWIPVLAWYGGLSALSFLVHGLDKLAASRGGRRTREVSLLSLDLLGGWPGGLAARWIFRHKTRSRSYRLSAWLVILVHLLVAGMVLRHAL